MTALAVSMIVAAHWKINRDGSSIHHSMTYRVLIGCFILAFAGSGSTRRTLALRNGNLRIGTIAVATMLEAARNLVPS